MLLAEMDPTVFWTAIIGAIFVGLTNLAVTITGMVLSYLRDRELKKDVQTNTTITKEGTEAATTTAAEAKKVAGDLAETVTKKLNGGIDAAIVEGVAPVLQVLEKHTEDDLRSLAEIREKFNSLEQYVHARNHDVLNALGIQSNNLTLILTKLEQRDAAASHERTEGVKT